MEKGWILQTGGVSMGMVCNNRDTPSSFLNRKISAIYSGSVIIGLRRLVSIGFSQTNQFEEKSVSQKFDLLERKCFCVKIY